MSPLVIGQTMALVVGISAFMIAYAQHEEIRQWEWHRTRVPPSAVRLRRRSLRVGLAATLLTLALFLLK